MLTSLVVASLGATIYWSQFVENFLLLIFGENAVSSLRCLRLPHKEARISCREAPLPVSTTNSTRKDTWLRNDRVCRYSLQSFASVCGNDCRA